MTGDTLSCPQCQARLRRPSGLETAAAVVCPRCRAQFAAPADSAGRWAVAGPQPRVFLDPWRPAEQPQRQAPPDDEDYPRPPTRGRVLNVHLRVACAILALAILGALAAAVPEIRNIVGGGPIISLVGLYVAVVSFFRRFWLGVALGLSASAFSVLVFVLIAGLGWSPMEAHTPVCLMGLAYAVGSVPFLAWAALAPRSLEPAKVGRPARFPE